MKYSRKIIENTVRHWEKILESRIFTTKMMSEDQIINEIVQSDEFPNWAKAPYVVEWFAWLLHEDFRNVQFTSAAHGLNFLMNNYMYFQYMKNGELTTAVAKNDVKNIINRFSINTLARPQLPARYEILLPIGTRDDGMQNILFTTNDSIEDLDICVIFPRRYVESVKNHKDSTTVFLMESMDSTVATHVKLLGEDRFREIDRNGVVR